MFKKNSENVENYIDIAKTKANLSALKILVLGIMAGIFIAIAGWLSTVASYTIASASVAKIVCGLVFPIGLILVVLLKTELFTGNNLMIMGVYDKKIKIRKLLRNWGLCYLGNIIGAFLIAILFNITNTNTNLSLKFVNISVIKTSYSFVSALVLGILCNFLVCLAVWLATTVKEVKEKIILIFIPIFTFIALGFEHSVANMFYLGVGYLESSLGLKAILLNNLLPVTLGNIIGGAFILGTYLYFIDKKRS